MKNAFHKVLSIVMALVVLFSTMSFTIDMHFCGDQLVDTAIFSKLKTCGMESDNQTDTTLQSSDCSITKKKCCNEEHHMIAGQDELQLSFEKISFEQQLFVAAFFHAYSSLFITSEELTPTFDDYPPPIIVRDIYKLDETYLI